MNSFDTYSPDMLTYCTQDVNLTHKVMNELDKEKSKFSKESIELEKKVRVIIDKQEENGFTLDLRKAMTLKASLEDEANNLSNQATEIFPPTEVQLKTKVKYIPFNIGSRKQIAERLINKGWKPTLKTDKGNVIVNEEVLNNIDMKEAQMFSRYLLLQKRVSQIKSWIELCDDNNKVHGRVMTLKTVTGRMAHNSPNLAQVPAIYSPYGKECRDCWTVSDPENYRLVGTDASGLEIRALAHYMGAKIGKVVGAGPKEGQKLVDKFLSNLPELADLRTEVQEASAQGAIKGLDGRIFQIRSPHSALNTVLQGAGAIVCKQWLVCMMDMIDVSGIDAHLVASVHDEYQFEVNHKDVQKFGEITKKSIKITEEILKLNCPLDSEWKAGLTWASTH